jgi:diacylglycerol O-acyltransferase
MFQGWARTDERAARSPGGCMCRAATIGCRRMARPCRGDASRPVLGRTRRRLHRGESNRTGEPLRQLTDADASYLYSENSRVYGHIVGLIVVDPSTTDRRFDAELLREHVASRLHLLSPLRSRLVEVPYGIDLPYWVDDPGLDLTYHIRDTAVAAPGTDEQVAELVSRLSARHLDRNRPLWEMHAIQGMAGGRAAILLKIHHATIDGVSGNRLWATLLDDSPDYEAAPPPPAVPAPERVPPPAEMLWRGWAGLTKRHHQAWERHQAALIGAASKMGQRANSTPEVEGSAGTIQPRITSPAPRTSFNKSVTPHRRWAFGDLSLDDVKAVKNAAGVTVNDVVMSLVATALRRWLLDRNELPRDPLLAMVPLSTRTADQSDAMGGNQVVPMVAPLPTHVSDPRERLAAAHESMRAAKEEYRALPADVLQNPNQFAAPAAAELVARTLADFRVADYTDPPFNVVVSNVPGSRHDLYYAGARVLGHYPLSIVADGLGLNVTVQSHVSGLHFGITSCRELVRDVAELLGFVQEALDELKELYVTEQPAVDGGSDAGGGEPSPDESSSTSSPPAQKGRTARSLRKRASHPTPGAETAAGVVRKTGEAQGARKPKPSLGGAPDADSTKRPSRARRSARKIVADPTGTHAENNRKGEHDQPAE